MELWSRRWLLALCGYADWKNVSSRPNQMRLWMCTTCVHHNSSKAACSQCGVRSSWAEVVKGVQQTNSATPPSLPNEEIKALEAALAAPPDNVDLCGKVRAPLEERLQHARKKRRETANPWINVSKDVEAPFNALPRQSRLRLHSNKQHKRRSKKPKRTNLVFEKKELEKQALSQTAQPTCSQTTSCKAAPLSAAVTELSRHMPASEASAIQIALDGLLSLIAQAAERASRAEAEGTATRAWDCDDEDLDMDTPDDVLLKTPTTRHRKTTRKKCSVWSDVESDRKSVQKCRWGVLRMTPMTVVSANIATLDPKAERAAAREGLHQGQQAEELERLMTRVQTSSLHRNIGSNLLDRDVVGSSSKCTPAPAHKALLVLHFGSRETVSISLN